MTAFRLYNIQHDRLETFSLKNHPPYLATSHVWRENVFPADVTFFDSFGGQGIAAVVRARCPGIQYVWFDTKCIDQGSEQDKLEQIPLMDRIYGEAECTVIFLNTEINANQDQVDWLMRKIDGALAMCQAEAWTEEGAHWQDGEGRAWISMAMKALLRLTGTAWATRIWTLQEYVLAKKIVWIGKDLQPIEFDDYVFSALPDICDTLGLNELLAAEFMPLNRNFVGMANARLNNIDPTRIMELSANRQATVPVDQIYGLMAASGVTILPNAGETQDEVWLRWCAEAVRVGHMRWILLPASSEAAVDAKLGTCIFPSFSERYRLSTASGLDTVRPLGLTSVVDSTVTASARHIGNALLTRRLGPVHEPQAGRIHRDITLIIFAESKWSLALKLVSAFGGGRYNVKQTRAVAQVLVQSYSRATKFIAHGREESFHPVIIGDFQQHVWNDFMQLQQTIMAGVNHGVAYLCEISVSSVDSLSFQAVIVLGQLPSKRRFEMLDFEARSPDGRTLLMAVDPATLPDGSSVFHKVGMTLGVSADIANIWRSIPSHDTRIGGHGCSACLAKGSQGSKAAHDLVSMKTASTSKISLRKLQQLARHEIRIRSKLFALREPSSRSSIGAFRRKLRQWRLRRSLEGIQAVFQR